MTLVLYKNRPGMGSKQIKHCATHYPDRRLISDAITDQGTGF
ncbi:hypothetical protein [Nitrosomonas halophila]|nr:hypothetical protein [Nitrosomonas halophila]